MGLRSTERQAQRAFERQVLAQVLALCEPDGAVPAQRVEQALGYFRQTVAGNPAQQVLGRRLRGAIDALLADGLLDPTAPPDTFRPTDAGRALVAASRRPWWRRAFAITQPSHGGSRGG
ncbi:MAG TPA: hypothetical protein VK066_14625 [Chloroflexota bacterium]|nr:hypothetical protein [Chloroflexota bacterium]